MRARQKTVCAVTVLFIAGCAAGSDVTPSEVEAARDHLRPAVAEEEIDLAISACLEQNAVTAFEPDPQGGHIGQNVTERDVEVYEGCRQEAFAKYDWPPPQPETASEHRVLYDLYRRMAACLEELGFDLAVPTFEVYYDGGGAWFPYSDLPVPSSEEEWRLWNTTCPQNPWSYDAKTSGR